MNGLRALFVLLAVACAIASAQGVYKWKDANGNWHFSDQAPPGQKAETIRVSPALSHSAAASHLSAPDTPLMLNILSRDTVPVPGGGDWVEIIGEFSGPPDTGVAVLGHPVDAQDGRHFVARIPYLPGYNEVSVVLTTLDGRKQQKTVTMDRSARAPQPLRLVADDVCAMAPFEVSFHLESIPPSMRLVKASFDFNANGVPDASITDVSQRPTYRYDASGFYEAQADVTLANIADPAKIEHRMLERDVLCGDRAYVRQTLIFVYESLRDALGRKDIDAAVRVFAPDERPKYEKFFRALAAKGADISKELGTLEDGMIMPRNAMGLLVRDDNGVSHGFPIEFGMGNDGVWRINQM